MKRLNHLKYLAAAMMALPTLAFASLGGTVSSVQTDQVNMKATMHVASKSTKFTVHEIEMTTGTQVREYVGTDGKVFGVAWSGPAMPDLRQVLGSYFETFTKSTNVTKSGHSKMMVHESNLVVRSSGHMRAYRGNAYVPSMLPEGVTSNQIL
jgi:hypothetical protein